MKKHTLLIALILIVSFHHIHGLQIYPGNHTYGKEIVESIRENGTVTLENTRVQGLVDVNGSLKATGATINSLQVNGLVDLQNCLITNTAMINGSLSATNTKFQKELSVSSKKIVFNQCTLTSLTLREVSGDTGPQIIDLRNTEVTGKISVESGNGEVWISSKSEISKRQISGARVWRK